MFESEVWQSFVEQGLGMAEMTNQSSLDRFRQACLNWVANGGRTPKPAPDFKVESVFNPGSSEPFKLVVTDIPVSTLDPSTMLPTHGTDVDAVGGPVGGPIPAYPGRFYLNSGSHPNLGEMVKVNNRTFVCTSRSPFTRYWIEVAV